MPHPGSTYPLVVTYFTEPGGPAADVSDVTLTVLFDGAPILGPLTPPTVLHDAVGRYRYEWEIPDDAELGAYTARWSGTLPDETDPSVGYETVELTAAPEFSYPDFCWPVDTSCVAEWDAYEDGSDGPEPRYSEDAKARAVSLAGQTLRMLTAFRVGGCPVTIRPAAARCRDLTWRTYPAGGYGSTPWRPVNLGGTWLNIGCGHDGGCGCIGLREVRLGGSASSVSAVKVDGVALDPSAYRLDSGGRLVRLDGEAWPLCQNLAAPDTEPGTWSVTYTSGAAVDGLGAYAAGLLAGEFVKACSGADCALPDNVTQIVRNGVSMTLVRGAFPEGKTGIREVDLFIERWNPYGHKVPPMVWAPGLNRGRRTL